MKTLISGLIFAGLSAAQGPSSIPGANPFSIPGGYSIPGQGCCTFYVSQSTGSDSNPGTLSQPWQTTAKVGSTTLQANTTIVFLDSPTVTWRASFVDNFDGSSLNPNNWINTFFDGTQTIAGNGDLEWYASSSATVSGGVLSLTGNNDSPHSGFTYSSGMIESYGKFFQTYGRFEIRAQVPHGTGLWPAFWMLAENTTWPPENDIMEVFSFDTTINTSSMWFSDYLSQPRALSYLVPSGGTDFSLAYHTWAIDWSSTGMVWYLDGVEYYRKTQLIPSVPMYMIANMAIGGIAGTPSGITWPISYKIDYIRAWTRTPGGS